MQGRSRMIALAIAETAPSEILSLQRPFIPFSFMTTCLDMSYNQELSQGPQEKLKTENKMSLPAEQFVKPADGF